MITKQFLDEIEQKIRELRRVLRRKAGYNGKITVDIPFVNKQIDYIITPADRQVIDQEIAEKEQALKDKLAQLEKKI